MAMTGSNTWVDKAFWAKRKKEKAITSAIIFGNSVTVIKGKEIHLVFQAPPGFWEQSFPFSKNNGKR